MRGSLSSERRVATLRALRAGKKVERATEKVPQTKDNFRGALSDECVDGGIQEGRAILFSGYKTGRQGDENDEGEGGAGHCQPMKGSLRCRKQAERNL